MKNVPYLRCIFYINLDLSIYDSPKIRIICLYAVTVIFSHLHV